MKRFLSLAGAAFIVCCYSEICGLARVCFSFAGVVGTSGQVYKHASGERILCVGASHMGSSIVAKPFIKNMWLSSSSAESCLIRVKEMERRGQLTGFEYCVLETSPFDYGASCSDESRNRVADLFIRELPINWRYIWQTSMDTSMLIESLGREILASRTAFTSTFDLDCSDSSDAMPKGRLPMLSQPESWQKERLTFYLKLHYEDYDKTIDVTERRINLFTKIKAICERHGIKVLVFSAPLSSPYRKQVPAEAWRRHEKFLKQLARDDFLIFDRHDAYEDEYFFDPTHMADNGATRFTEELLSYLHM